MLELKPLPPKTNRVFLTRPELTPAESDLAHDPQHHDLKPNDPTQRRLMVVALALLLVALSLVIYHDWDFWSPDTQEADTDQPTEQAPANLAQHVPIVASAQEAATPAAKLTAKSSAKSKNHTTTNRTTTNHPTTSTSASTTTASNTAPATAPPIAVTNRTVLPPLEVEVVAGDAHRTVRPGSNSVHVDLQPGAPTQNTIIETPTTGNSNDNSETATNVTSNAAERVQMSADTNDVVSHPVQPGYPLLARQMKVQGSVILRALISRDGTIQDLHVMSGPPILATAAQDAVRQWHFRPHYLGNEAVETQAKITVNFTISTN